MRISRRSLLRAGGGAGALLLAPAWTRSAPTLQQPLLGSGADRRSVLMPGTRLVHADLHNHTLMSDGVGEAAEAFASMRDHGLDVAALTDHATVGQHLPASLCGTAFSPQEPTEPPRHDCQSVHGIDESSWARTAVLADTADDPGHFVAIRGFEWSSPTLGHMNVWFSEDWTDPLHTAGGWTEAGMALFYEWLTADPARPAHGGGADGIAGFNHPGREEGRFATFAYDAVVADRVVSMEIFNRREDYLFEGFDAGEDSPLVQCLDAGWHVGLLGVTDEHGDDWGGSDGKGRAGLWVHDLSRDGVREAMRARRFFATNETGLQLAATARSAQGSAVAMGGHLTHVAGDVTFELDLDLGPAGEGRQLLVQVLTTGAPLPTVREVVPVTVGADGPTRFAARLSVDDAPWVVLRVSDPALEPDGRAPASWAGYGKGIAYASPFRLRPPADGE